MSLPVTMFSLHRPSLTMFGGMLPFEDGAADLHQLARMRVGRQPEHHRDAAIAAEAAGENLRGSGCSLL